MKSANYVSEVLANDQAENGDFISYTPAISYKTMILK
jgi:hypothetical protein